MGGGSISSRVPVLLGPGMDASGLRWGMGGVTGWGTQKGSAWCRSSVHAHFMLSSLAWYWIGQESLASGLIGRFPGPAQRLAPGTGLRGGVEGRLWCQALDQELPFWPPQQLSNPAPSPGLSAAGLGGG